MKDLIRTNWLLIFIVPLNIVFGLYLVNWAGNDAVYELITLVVISTMELGLVREMMVRNLKPTAQVFWSSLRSSFIVSICLLLIVSFLFKYALTVDLLLYFTLSLALNEVKAFFDGNKRYDIGLVIRTIGSSIIPLTLLIGFEYSLYMMLPIVIFGLKYVWKKMSYIKVDKSRITYIRFSLINAFSILSGNIEKMILSYYLPSSPWVPTFLIFGEYNRRLHSIYGFFTPFFLFGHLTNVKRSLMYLLLSLFVAVGALYTLLNLENSYLLFSISTVVSIICQYAIYIILRKLKGSNTSYFGLLGSAFLIIGIAVLSWLDHLSFISLIFVISLKSLLELLYLKIVSGY